MTLDVDAATAGASGELRVLGRGDLDVRLAVELHQLLQDHRARGHVDPESERLRREDRPDAPCREQLLDDLAEEREHAGVVGGEAAGDALDELVVPEDVEVLPLEDGSPLLDRASVELAVALAHQTHVVAQQLTDGALAPGSAEDEGDRWQQPVAIELADDLGPGGGPAEAAPSPTARPLAAAAPVVATPASAATVTTTPVATAATLVVLAVTSHAGADGIEQLGVDLRRGPGGAVVDEEVVDVAADLHVLPQRDRALLGHDDLGAAAHLGEPGTELLGVAHGRREGDDLDRAGQVDDDLLPHGAAEAVGEVVHLVHDDESQRVEGRGAGVDHVAQDLGRHDDDRGLAVDRDVTGEQADAVVAVAGGELVVLLVAQGLDRRRVEGLLPPREGQVHGELADDRLARAGRGSDEHAVSPFDRLAGLPLEGVELKAQALDEGGELTGSATAGGGKAFGGRGHDPTLCQRVSARSTARRGPPRRWPAGVRRARRRRS